MPEGNGVVVGKPVGTGLGDKEIVGEGVLMISLNADCASVTLS